MPVSTTCRGSITASASRSSRRRAGSCPTPRRARRGSAAKCSARCSDMSRIGKHPVVVPSGVTVSVEGHKVTAKGKLGELALQLPPEVSVVLEDGQVTVQPRDKEEK